MEETLVEYFKIVTEFPWMKSRRAGLYFPSEVLKCKPEGGLLY